MYKRLALYGLIATVFAILLQVFIGCDQEFSPDYPAIDSQPVIYCVYDIDLGVCPIKISSTYRNNQKSISDGFRVVLEGLDNRYPIWETGFQLNQNGIYEPVNILQSNPGGRIGGRNSDITVFRLIVDHDSLNCAFAEADFFPLPVVIEPSKPDFSLNVYQNPLPKFKISLNKENRRNDFYAYFIYYRPSTDFIDSTLVTFKQNIQYTGEYVMIYLDPDSFYKDIAKGFDPGDGERKVLKSINFYFKSCDDIIDDFIDTYINASDHSGLIQGNFVGGIGVFGITRTIQMKEFFLHQRSLDSLAHGIHTMHLNFADYGI